MGRRTGSFSARLRGEIHGDSQRNVAPDDLRDAAQDGYPCPRHIKPLLYFYKYLQPLPDGRKLRLNLPITVTCERKEGREDVLWLSSDVAGCVIREDKGPAWRKRMLADFTAPGDSTDPDAAVAVRNVAHWKGGANNKSIVLTRRALDHIVNAPMELPFSIQRFVRCRGSRASIFRVTWGEKESRRFAVNIFNESKSSEAPLQADEESERLGTAVEIALAQMERLSPFYCVTSTMDPKQLKLPKMRGSPVKEGVDTVKRVVDHFVAHLPGLKVRELTADFIKDASGVWWFTRVVDFDACYRAEPLPNMLNLSDSAVTIPDALRSKQFRQTLRTITVAHPESNATAHCSLCACSCELPPQLQEELHELVMSLDESQDVFKALSEYRMTLKMAVTTLFQLRQRGIVLTMWENALLLLMKAPGRACEFVVCYLCYRVYKEQVRMCRVAKELHEAYGISQFGLYDAPPNDVDTTNVEPSDWDTSAEMIKISTVPPNLLGKIHAFQDETCALLTIAPGASAPTSTYLSIAGVDIDPTCLQLRLVFFFHELQDGGPGITPTDFYLEYQIGQAIHRLEFDGSKFHTPNRWQLCEARVHYVMATKDQFGEYCTDKRLRVKMKSVRGDEFHGQTSVPLRPLLGAAKWFGNVPHHETRSDYLLEIRTDHFGLLTLKLTVGLLVDPVQLCQVRETMKDIGFLKEQPFAVFWPPPGYHSCVMPVPVDWIGALTPSEYISTVPMKPRRGLLHTRHRMEHGTGISAHPHFDAQTGTSKVSDKHGVPSSRDIESIRDRRSKIPILSSAVNTVQRLVQHLAGAVSSFPTFVLAALLRHACFLSAVDVSVASWTEPATLRLTNRHTIDTIYADAETTTLPVLCFLGELLFVLLKCQLVPTQLEPKDFEELVAPYWLYEEAGGYEPVRRQATPAPAQRMVWNRAIRRCQVSSFCSGFPQYRAAMREKEPEVMSKYEQMNRLRRKMSYRSKAQSRGLCEIFEAMEASDSGYIEVAELRSQYNVCADMHTRSHSCLQAESTGVLCPSIRDLGSQRHLGEAELSSLAQLLDQQQQRTEFSVMRCLMKSETMLETLSYFDRLGTGGLNFDDFCELSATVMELHSSSFRTSEEEPTSTGFCLRHGLIDMYAMDCVCTCCSFEYQDHTLTHRQTVARASLSSDGSDSGFDDKEDDGEIHFTQGESPVQHSPSSRSMSSFAGPRSGSPVRRTASQISDVTPQFEPAALTAMLQTLEAAEWHICHRQESLGKAALEAALSERRPSSITVRRPSSLSMTSERLSSKESFATLTAIADLVAEAERRKHEAFGDPSSQMKVIDTDVVEVEVTSIEGASSQRGSTVTTQLRKVRKKKTKKLQVLNTHPKISADNASKGSRTLSALLRMEFADTSQSHSAQPAATGLVNCVRRVESKRKQLDRLVVAELEDVKQRLSRLMGSS